MGVGGDLVAGADAEAADCSEKSSLNNSGAATDPGRLAQLLLPSVGVQDVGKWEVLQDYDVVIV